jgi:polyphosphate kinase
VYLSSADWMDRNFFRRIEVCFPILDKKLKKRVIEEGLKVYLQDNSQAWDMDSNGHYRAKTSRRSVLKCAQSTLLQQLADPVPQPL